MFQLIEKDNKRMPVHSKGDLAYMLARGWKAVQPNEVVEEYVEPPAVEKRKAGRPKKR